MQLLLRISGLIDALTEAAGKLLNYLVLIMILTGFYNVFARYLGRYVGMRLTSNALIEIQWYFFTVIFFLGFAYILKHNLNVRVDFWYTNWSLRRKTLVDLIGTILFIIPFCIIGIYVTLNPVLFSWGRLPDGTFGTWEISPDPDGLPRAPIKSMIIIGLALLLLQAISQLIKYVAILRESLPSDAAEEIESYQATAIE